MRSALVLAVFCLLHLYLANGPAIAQRPAATPIPAVLFRATPQSVDQLAPAPTSLPAEASLAASRLEALPSAGEVNVRILPDVESELLGVIKHGTAYPALRVYYRWHEFRYDLSPTGRAWVYGDLVSLDGDVSQLVVIENYADIAADSRDDTRPENRAIIVATAESGAAQNAGFARSPLPTFTPPAATQSAYTGQLFVTTTEESRRDNLPPLAPIIALGGLGMLGIFVSLLRR